MMAPPQASQLAALGARSLSRTVCVVYTRFITYSARVIMSDRLASKDKTRFTLNCHHGEAVGTFHLSRLILFFFAAVLFFSLSLFHSALMKMFIGDEP